MRLALALFAAAAAGASALRNASVSNLSRGSANVTDSREEELRQLREENARLRRDAEIRKLREDNARLRRDAQLASESQEAELHISPAKVVAAPAKKNASKPSATVSHTATQELAPKNEKEGPATARLQRLKGATPTATGQSNTEGKGTMRHSEIKAILKDLNSAESEEEDEQPKAHAAPSREEVKEKVAEIDRALEATVEPKQNSSAAKAAKPVPEEESPHAAARAKLRASIKAMHTGANATQQLKKSERINSHVAESLSNKPAIKSRPANATDAAVDKALEHQADIALHLEEVSEAQAAHSALGKKTLRILGKPPDETMKPIIKQFKEMIAKLEELNLHDGNENRMMFCKDVKKSLEDAKKPFEEELPKDAHPMVKNFVRLNVWAIDQSEKEIEFMCQAGFRSIREENRLEAFREVVTTYLDGIKCQPGDQPCVGGRLTGERPLCTCTCNAGFKHGPMEGCEVKEE